MLKPDDGNLQHWYSQYRMTRGRVEESLAASLRAIELDPLDLTLNAHLGWHYLYAREYDRAADIQLYHHSLLRRDAVSAERRCGLERARFYPKESFMSFVTTP